LPNLEDSGNSLYALAAIAPNDIWAAGVNGNQEFSRALIMHYDGSQWGVHKTFTEGDFPSIMYSVAARSANDVWAVGAIGSAAAGIRGLIAHWDGHMWRQLADDEIGVNLSEAWDVTAAPGAPDVWIAGQHGRTRDVAAVIHRGAGEWERDGEDLRVADQNYLRGITALSNTEVWAVGYGQSTNLQRPLMMRTTNGTDWSALPGAQVEGAAALYDIASIPGGDLIAVGTANGGALVEMYRDPCAPAPAPPTPTAEATQPPAASPTPTGVPTFAPTPIPGDTTRTFPETGKTVRGLFLDYWERNGGLAQQGYPISDMFTEISALNGKPYTVQYFERAVFEYHPDNQAPYNVLLSQLGTFQYKQKYPNGAPGQTPNTSEGSVLFPETGHRVGGKFLAYWQQNGALAQQGYPISDEFMEKSDLNGQTYLVQYFERAVFELHPENEAPYDVLLSQLGTFQYREKYLAAGAGSTPVAATTPTPDGWAALGRRPLDLPSVAPGAPCPVTPSRQIVPAPPASMAAESGIGDGPIYPVAHYFAEGTTLRLRSDMEDTPGWFTTKVRWVGSPDYEGPVLVRGRRIDGDGEVRFEFDDPSGRRTRSPEMELEALSGWNDWPSATLLPSPGAGCYAYQVDGTNFMDVIVFRAVIEP
jgi:hypothetical protein